jgi:hypothetical protein
MKKLEELNCGHTFIVLPVLLGTWIWRFGVIREHICMVGSFCDPEMHGD